MIASMLNFLATHWLYLIMTAFIMTLALVVYIQVDKEHTHDDLLAFFKKVGGSLLHWTWTKSFLFWLIISAGTFSELAFLLASAWMSVNAVEHSFILMFMNELQSEQIGYFAKSAYVVLPVFILPLGVTTTLSRLRTWRHTRTFWHSGIWCVLYGLPTLTFLVIDVFIIGNSNTEHYVLPDILVTLRSIMAYTYGLIAIIYYYVGKQQEADRLQEKDKAFEDMRAEKDKVFEELRDLKEREIIELRTKLQAKIEMLEGEYQKSLQVISEQHETLKTQASRVNGLELLVNKSSDTALEAYGEECASWLNSGSASFLIDEITQYTGHSWQKIKGAMKTGNLQKPRTRLKDRDSRVSRESLIPWLIENAPVECNTDSIPALHVVGTHI